MNKDKREELYYKQLDLIVRQWMCDIHYSISNTKSMILYDHIFTLCRSKLREVYEMDANDNVDHIEAEEEEDSFNVPLSSLNLPPKMYKVLSEDGIRSVNHVLCAKDSVLLSIPGFGRTSLYELRRILRIKFPNHWSHSQNDR